MKIETIALAVAVVGVGMALYFNRTGQGLVLAKTQYGQGWSDGPASIKTVGSDNGTIWL